MTSKKRMDDDLKKFDEMREGRAIKTMLPGFGDTLFVAFDKQARRGHR